MASRQRTAPCFWCVFYPSAPRRFGSLSTPARAVLVSPIFIASAVPFFLADLFSLRRGSAKTSSVLLHGSQRHAPPLVAKNLSQSARRAIYLNLGDTFFISQAYILQCTVCWSGFAVFWIAEYLHARGIPFFFFDDLAVPLSSLIFPSPLCRSAKLSIL